MQSITFRLIIFIILFTILFFSIRYFNLLPPVSLFNNIDSIPSLFSGIVLIFSIISAFVIEMKWQTWDHLIDATHGELHSFRQLHILSHHFPKSVRDKIKLHICEYLSLVIEASKINPDLHVRSEQIDIAMYQLEETVLDIDYSQHPAIGNMTFNLMRDCMDYREKRLQVVTHQLPLGVKVFVISATFFTILSSLFVGVNILIYDYMFTLIIALLSFGIYLLIDDLDHPYRPGPWHLKIDDYKHLLEELKSDTTINPPAIK